MIKPSIAQSTFFSIIIPTHNRAEKLLQCLNTIQMTRYPKSRIEIIIVDDGSTDDTTITVAGYKKSHKNISIRYLQTPTLGPSHARNAGVSHAKYRYAFFRDDDIIIAPNALHKIDAVVRKYPNAALISCRIGLRNTKLHRKLGNLVEGAEYVLSKTSHAYTKPTVVTYPFIMLSGALCLDTKQYTRHPFHPRLGTFYDTAFVRGEDVELSWRTALSGKTMVYAAHIRVIHEHSKKRLTRKYFFWRFIMSGAETRLVDAILSAEYPEHVPFVYDPSNTWKLVCMILKHKDKRNRIYRLIHEFFYIYGYIFFSHRLKMTNKQ